MSRFAVPARAQSLRQALSPVTTPPPASAFTPAERRLVARLRTPAAVQHWLNDLPYNAETGGETLRTFRGVVQRGTAHCLEAALFAAVTLEQHGYPPLLLSFESIDRLDHVLPSSNLFYAVRADGEFEFVKVRSVSRQERPYQPLEEAVRAQAVFDLQSVRGTLIGFRSPPFARGVAVPGYHFHFITADRSAGGHVLDLRVRDLDVAVDDSDELRLVLPRQGDFSGADLTPDRREALTRVESAPRGRQAGP